MSMPRRSSLSRVDVGAFALLCTATTMLVLRYLTLAGVLSLGMFSKSQTAPGQQSKRRLEIDYRQHGQESARGNEATPILVDGSTDQER